MLIQFDQYTIKRVDVVNRGFSGYNSDWGLLILERAVVLENPDLVFIFFGANDAIDESVLQYVPLNRYTQNIRNIIQNLRKVLIYTYTY